ncbi:MAG: cytochrome c [Acidimicrobiia bacterium]|nr:cytochrome c [Acidimicrobiia bacterium]
MWKKLLACGVLVLVLVLGGGFAYLYFRNPATASPSSVRIEPTEARLARGKYLYHYIGACGDCHSERDFTRFGGPVVEGREGVGFVFPPEMEFPGTVVAPNITPDKDTGIGSWSDGEIIRAVREGIGRDGKALFPLMPYADFRKMSDDDVYALVAYLRTLPPVKNPLPRSRINFPVSMFIKSAPQPAGHVLPVDRSNTLKYGEYLVTLGGCGGCHTPTQKGEPLPGKRLAGGEVFRTSMGTVLSANITPDKDTGIGKWSERDFLNKFYQYRRYVEQGSPKVGPEGFTLMPWLPFCQLPKEDLKAIFAFLKTQAPAYNAVETHPAELQPVVPSS